jgi:hypothetical protein
MLSQWKNRLAVLLFLMWVPVSDAQDIELSGIFIWGHETRVFQPCGDQAYWISASPAVLSPLLSFYQANTDKPYQGIFITVRAHRHNEVIAGFAADYPGLIHLSEVYSYAREIPRSCELKTPK